MLRRAACVARTRPRKQGLHVVSLGKAAGAQPSRRARCLSPAAFLCPSGRLPSAIGTTFPRFAPRSELRSPSARWASPPPSRAVETSKGGLAHIPYNKGVGCAKHPLGQGDDFKITKRMMATPPRSASGEDGSHHGRPQHAGGQNHVRN